MNNSDFLRSIDITDNELFENGLTAMDKYGDNHWWEEVESNPKKFAYYQSCEPIGLCKDFSQYHDALILLVGRPVWSDEIYKEYFKAEVRKAWEDLNNKNSVATLKSNFQRAYKIMGSGYDDSYIDKNHQKLKAILGYLKTTIENIENGTVTIQELQEAEKFWQNTKNIVDSMEEINKRADEVINSFINGE